MSLVDDGGMYIGVGIYVLLAPKRINIYCIYSSYPNSGLFVISQLSDGTNPYFTVSKIIQGSFVCEFTDANTVCDE